MRDFLPNEMLLRSFVFEKIIDVYTKRGFMRIETPAVEDLDFLSKDKNSENNKLIFSILKRGAEFSRALDSGDFSNLADLGLRYDLTVPLARYFASNRSKLPTIFKSIQIGPVWRAERPQKGRYRQFYQCDLDILGNPSILCEAELINTVTSALLETGLENFIIHINDRRILSALVKSCGFTEEQSSVIFIILDKFDKIGLEGVKEELNSFSSESIKVDLLLKTISSTDLFAKEFSKLKNILHGYLNPQVIQDIQFLIENLNNTSAEKYQCVFDLTLVRGMGYYTGPIFEITYRNYPFSIAGGGRYDNMIKQIINVDKPACGISIGVDRLIEILKEEQLLSPETNKCCALIYDAKLDPYLIMSIINQLWLKEESITLFPKQNNFGKQLQEISTYGIKKYLLLDGQGKLSSIKEIA